MAWTSSPSHQRTELSLSERPSWVGSRFLMRSPSWPPQSRDCGIWSGRSVGESCEPYRSLSVGSQAVHTAGQYRLRSRRSSDGGWVRVEEDRQEVVAVDRDGVDHRLCNRADPQ